MSKKIALGTALILIAAFAIYAYAGQVNLTTYYPAPYGEYVNLRTTQDAYFATQSGSVNIGTDLPGTSKIIKTFSVPGAAASVPSELNMGLVDGYGDVGISFKSFRDGAANSQSIELKTHHTGVTGGTRMTIDKDGNVGIGTTTPTQKLDVNGGFFHQTYNTTIIPSRTDNLGGLTIGWNRSGGSAEVNLYNVFNNATTAFQFSQITGSGTYRDLMSISGNGGVNIAGSGGNSYNELTALDLIVKGRIKTGGYADVNGQRWGGVWLGDTMFVGEGVLKNFPNVKGAGFWSNASGWVLGVTEGGDIRAFGDVTVSGDISYTGNLTHISDVRLKKNIKTLSSPLGKLSKVRGVKFEFRRDEFKDRNLPKGEQIGVIAQEIEKEFPELVSTDEEGYKSVTYDKLAAVLIQAVNEQQKEIELLKTEVSQLKQK